MKISFISYLCIKNEDMKKIEDPSVMVCLSYDSLFDDYAAVDPVQLLKDVPSLAAFDYIVRKTHEVAYAFSDIESQKNFIYELNCYLNTQEKERLCQYLNKYDKPYFIDNQTSFLFYMLVLQNFNSEDRRLTNTDIINIYKAYLYCSQLWTDKQCKKEGTFSSIIEAAIRIDLPVVEFKLHKDFKSQIYKASRFFEFCKRDDKFTDFSKLFYKEKGVNDYVEYITTIFSFYSTTLNGCYITIPPEYSSQIAFFEQFVIDYTECSTLWNDRNLNYLRNHFLIKVVGNTYLILNTNFLVDKFYQGLIFDFWKIVETNRGTNNKGKVIKDFGDFKSLFADKFSETMILYDILYRSFGNLGYKLLNGIELKKLGISAEPDFYIRNNNSIFLFEYKDLILSDDVKSSNDYDFVKSEILKRICKDGDSNRKGGAQLLFNINRILYEHLLDTIDQPVNKDTIIYPIIVTSDRSFDALGVNMLLIEEFTNIAKAKYPQLQGVCKLPIIINIDNLFLLMTRINSKELIFENVVNHYCNAFETAETAMMPFSTFVIDYYPKSAFDKKELNYMFNDIFGE